MQEHSITGCVSGQTSQLPTEQTSQLPTEQTSQLPTEPTSQLPVTEAGLSTETLKEWRAMLTWKQWTQYSERTFVCVDAVLNLYTHKRKYYWRLREAVAEIPFHMYQLFKGIYKITEIYGPYTFYNEFEHTAEGRYIKSLLRYKTIAKSAQRKLGRIIKNNRWWIKQSPAFWAMLRARDISK